MNIYSIGFTQKKAEEFFNLIKNSDVKTLVDVRLNNTSQLSGFAKRDDLKFFLKEVLDIKSLSTMIIITAKSGSFSREH